MARKRKRSSGDFAIISRDTRLSEDFRALSDTQKLFYYDCLIQAKSRECRACLKAHIIERNVFCGDDKNKDLEMYLNWENGYFVFPGAHLETFGYSRSNGSKLLGALVRAGFIRKVEDNSKRWKVNVYQFLK